MNQLLKYTIFLALSPLFLHSFEMPCSCNPHGSLDLIGGYRTDESSIKTKTYTTDGDLLFTDKLKTHQIEIGQIGLEGRLEAFQGIFVKGYANYGWVGDGRFNATTTDVADASFAVKAHANKGHVKDFSVGAGYLFTFEHYLSIGPVAGWAYNSQYLKISRATEEGTPVEILSGLSNDTRWEGPWIGLEGQFELGVIKIRGGYDYHFAWWKSDFKFDNAFIDGKFNMKSHNGSGNVAFIDAFYTCCGGWEIGLGIKYQYWTSGKGKISQTFAADPDFEDVVKLRSSYWKSCEGRLTLGYSF